MSENIPNDLDPEFERFLNEAEAEAWLQSSIRKEFGEALEKTVVPNEILRPLRLPANTTFGKMKEISPDLLLEKLLDIRGANTKHLVDRLQNLPIDRPSMFRDRRPSLHSFYYDRLFTPVSPLLLASAIAVSLAAGEDYFCFLEAFIQGDDVPEMEKRLYALLGEYQGHFSGYKLLSEVLPLENLFVDALIKKGVDLLVKGQVLPPDLANIKNKENYFYSYFDAYWAAWLAVNPILLQNPFAEQDVAKSVLSPYGFQRNSMIHNYRELYEQQDASLVAEINKFLDSGRQKDYPDLMNAYMEMKTNSTLLVERMERFYLWLPHEITANIAGLQAELKECREVEFSSPLLPQAISESLRNLK